MAWFTIYVSSNVHEKRTARQEDKWVLVYDKSMTSQEIEDSIDSLKALGYSVRVFTGRRGKLIKECYI